MSSRFLKQRPPQGALQKLTPAQHARLVEWLQVPTNTYKEVVRLLREEMGIESSGTAVANFYKRCSVEILGPPSRPVPVPASGVAVTVTCQRLGELKLAIRPLLPNEVAPVDGAADVRAGGVEVVAAQGTTPGEIRLLVKPLPVEGAQP